jgi:ribosomal RNA-processing protein 1
MWMSDRPRVQQQLARDLAGLVEVIPDELVIPFLEAFWRTMAREWVGIDVLRYAHHARVLLNFCI